MSKPVVAVEFETFGGKKGRAEAVFDTGAYPTLIREDLLPPDAVVDRRPSPLRMKTAAEGGTLTVTGSVTLTITVADRVIQDAVLVSPDLSKGMLIGAGTMQKWDISIRNENGHTTVHIARDLRDPDIQEVD